MQYLETWNTLQNFWVWEFDGKKKQEEVQFWLDVLERAVARRCDC